MRSYEAARTLFSFLAFCAWSVVVIGVLVALIGASGGSRYGGAGAGFLAMVPGLGISIAGLLLLAFVQMGRAGVDTAEYTQQMLKISRDQLEISRQALTVGGEKPKLFEATKGQEKSGSGFNRTGFAKNGEARNDGKVAAQIPAPKPDMLEGETLDYLGQTISHERGMFLVGGQSFNSLSYAKNYAERAHELHKNRKR